MRLRPCTGCWRCLSAGTTPGRSARPASTAEKMPNSAPQVKTAFQANRRVYGSPRVHAELHAQGIHCAKAPGSPPDARTRTQGVTPTSSHDHHDIREPEAQVAPNLLQRDFSAQAPNSKWVADTTYIWTAEGWLFLAVVLDLFSPMVVGWSLAAIQDATLVVQALHMAIARRRPSFRFTPSHGSWEYLHKRELSSTLAAGGHGGNLPI